MSSPPPQRETLQDVFQQLGFEEHSCTQAEECFARTLVEIGSTDIPQKRIEEMNDELYRGGQFSNELERLSLLTAMERFHQLEEWNEMLTDQTEDPALSTDQENAMRASHAQLPWIRTLTNQEGFKRNAAFVYGESMEAEALAVEADIAKKTADALAAAKADAVATGRAEQEELRRRWEEREQRHSILRRPLVFVLPVVIQRAQRT